MDPQITVPFWGWHTAVQPHNIDDAVIIYDYDHVTGRYTQWLPIEHQIPGDGFISLDMAFELTTVPEPVSMILAGLGLSGIAAIVRKRMKK